MSLAKTTNQKQNANENAKSMMSGFVFTSSQDKPFELPIDATKDTYPILKNFFPRGFEVYQIFIDDTQMEYFSIFFDADRMGKQMNSSSTARVIASLIGISPTGNLLIWRKKRINKEDCLVHMDMCFDEFFWRGIVGKHIRESAYFLPPCCWNRDLIKKNCDENNKIVLMTIGNTREELKAKNAKNNARKKQAKKAKKTAGQADQELQEAEARMMELEDFDAKKTRSRICGVCSNPSRNVCEGCRKIYYCSLDCQRCDWKEHKKICKA